MMFVHSRIPWLGAVALSVACRASLPAPPPLQTAATVPPAAPSDDPGAAVTQVRQIESACRARLQADTVQASLRAVDRMRLALGAVCDVESVGDDPLHWLFRCRADALFELGHFDFAHAAGDACLDVPALRETPVNRWVCAGALVQDSRGLLGGVEIAVVGHVDNVRLNPDHPFSPCPGLRTAMGYSPSPPWPDLPAHAAPEARHVGNDQLAWCRAANVALHLRCGMSLAQHGGVLPAGDPCVSVPTAPSGAVVTVLGAGTAWQDAQPPGACTAPPAGAETYQGDCPEARRVDVFVKFIPTAASLRSTCDHPGDDPATALYCLQDCLERAAAPTRGDRTTDVPLLVPCGRSAAPLPAGWYRVPTPRADGACREVNLDAVRRSLHIAP